MSECTVGQQRKPLPCRDSGFPMQIHQERVIILKLNSGFIVHSDGEEKLLVSTGSVEFSGLVRSNATAGFIIGCLEHETTEDEIVAKMLKKWDVSDQIARRDVRKIISQLRGIGAIDG